MNRAVRRGPSRCRLRTELRFQPDVSKRPCSERAGPNRLSAGPLNLTKNSCLCHRSVSRQCLSLGEAGRTTIVGRLTLQRVTEVSRGFRPEPSRAGSRACQEQGRGGQGASHTVIIDQGHLVIAHEPALPSARVRGVGFLGDLAEEGHTSSSPRLACEPRSSTKLPASHSGTGRATYIRLDSAARGRHFGDLMLCAGGDLVRCWYSCTARRALRNNHFGRARLGSKKRSVGGVTVRDVVRGSKWRMRLTALGQKRWGMRKLDRDAQQP